LIYKNHDFFGVSLYLRYLCSQKMAIKITYRLTSRLSMRIVRSGDVHVSAPVGLPRSVVEAFIREHADWIVAARQRTLQRVKQRDDFYAQLPLATTAQRRAAADRLSAIVEPLVKRYSREMNVQPSSVTYRALKSRWGQCNVRTRQICISTYALLLPDRCIEHVVVHELCHLLEPSHNARFHALMTQYYPRWRQARQATRQLTKG
jgi:predicted metal-dependent hydrolase